MAYKPEDRQLRKLRAKERPTNFDDEQFSFARDLPQFTGKRGTDELEEYQHQPARGGPYTKTRRGDNHLDFDQYWYDGNNNNKFDFGEFFDFDGTVESGGENLARGYATTQMNNQAYDEGRFGRDFLGRIREGGGTDREMRANELQQYLNNEPVDPSGIGMFAGSKPTDNRFGQAAKMLGSAVLAPSVGAVSNAFDALPLPAYNSVHGFHEGTNWSDRTTPLTNAAADVALSAPVLGPVAKTIQGGINTAKVPLKAMQGPVRSVRNFKPGAGRWPPLTPEPLKEAAKSAKSLTQDFATGATTTVRELPGMAKKLLSSSKGLLAPTQNKVLWGGGATVAGSELLENAGTEWIPDFEDDEPIDRPGELENFNETFDLDDNRTISPLSNDQLDILDSAAGRAEDEGDFGREGPLGTSGSMSSSASPDYRDYVDDLLEKNDVRSLDDIGLPKGTDPAPGSPMHGDSPAFPGGVPATARPLGDMQNKGPIVEPDTLDSLRRDTGVNTNRPSQMDVNPNIRPASGSGHPNLDVDGSNWADAPPMQRQPAAMPTEQEKFDLFNKQNDPRYMQAVNDADDFRQLLATDHPVSRRPVDRPTYLDKPDRTFHYKDGVKQVIPGKKFMGGRWDPYTSIRNAAAEQRSNSDLGAKAKVQERLLRERLGGQGGLGAQGEAGPVGMEDAVNEAGAAEMQAYHKTHNLDEPTDPMEKTRFAKWYNTHGKRNDINDRWADSEPYPKFDPYLT
jgi:hypothetical protein